MILTRDRDADPILNAFDPDRPLVAQGWPSWRTEDTGTTRDTGEGPESDVLGLALQEPVASDYDDDEDADYIYDDDEDEDEDYDDDFDDDEDEADSDDDEEDDDL